MGHIMIQDDGNGSTGNNSILPQKSKFSKDSKPLRNSKTVTIAPLFSKKEWTNRVDASIVEEMSSDDSVSLKSPTTARQGKFSSSGSPQGRGSVGE